MSIALKPEEQVLRKEIEERVQKVNSALIEYRIDDEVSRLIGEMGERAHRLHMMLKARGQEPKHHAYMIKNRELPAHDEQFYMHFHPIQDLLKFLDDPHANDDPEDQTIGKEFTFRVFSPLWGRDDSYRIKRTEDGWDVHFLTIGGPCDRGGRPFLFANLDHDCINYPSGLEYWMRSLWDRAASRGLSHAQVQDALQNLADWVNMTQKGAPSGGVWA